MTEWKMDPTHFIKNEYDIDKDVDIAQVKKDAKNQIDIWVKEILDHQNLDRDSVYTGCGGVIYMLLHLYFSNERDGKYVEMASKWIPSLEHDVQFFKDQDSFDDRDVTFLTGVMGSITLLAIYSDLTGKKKDSEGYITLLVDFHKSIDEIDSCELMYGRSGYLYCLLLSNHYFAKSVVPKNIISKVVKGIVDQGKLGRNQDINMMWKWHNHPYLGAAHGVSGIIHTLLSASVENDVLIDVDKLMETVIRFQLKDGNYKDNTHVPKCQWCYGAPAMMPTLLKCHERFSKREYLESAKKCAEFTWTHGLLTKGLSLCHGVAGNGYMFLQLYHHTRDERYHRMALYFAKFCLDSANHHRIKWPDHPYSLFEGIAGTVCFLQDIISNTSDFPAFSLPSNWNSQ